MTRLPNLRIIGGHTLMLDTVLTGEDGTVIDPESVVPKLIVSREGKANPVAIVDGELVDDAFRFTLGYEETIKMGGNYVYYFSFSFDFGTAVSAPIREWYGHLNVIPGVPIGEVGHG